MSFSEDMKKLETIMQKFESSELDMEESLALFESGVKLIRECRDYLEKAKRKVTMLTEGEEAECELSDD